MKWNTVWQITDLGSDKDTMELKPEIREKSISYTKMPSRMLAGWPYTYDASDYGFRII